MAIQRIESLVYGVEDVAEGIRYFEDWGLEAVERGAHGATFRTGENQTVHLRDLNDAGLPSSPETGSTVREVVWGVDGVAGIQAIGAELEKDRAARLDADGTLHSHDESGFAVAFRVSERTPADIEAPPVNVNDREPRFNDPVRPEKRARPFRIGHVVYRIPEKGAAEACTFYRERLRFRLSERAADTGDFMRCEAGHDHHNLFIAHRADRPQFNHVAFEVRSFDEIMLGGKHMQSRGWTADTRPGRHIMGSNLFWYFRNPCGGRTEYFADMDRLGEDWVAPVWEKNPGYALWLMD